MNIAVVFDKLVEGTTGMYVVRALQELGHHVEHCWLRDADRLSPGYDLYFRVDHGYYDRDLPSFLKPSLFWALDIHLDHAFTAVTNVSRTYTMLFGAHRSQVERLQKRDIPIEWVPFACDPAIHYQKTDGVTRYDLVFVGGDDGAPRKFLLQELRERYPKSMIGEAPYHQMAELYSAASIGFNYSIRAEINMRVFEVMACGALLLTNALPPSDVERLGLKPGRDFVEYENVEELFTLIRYYLCHEDERTRIAESGHARVIQEHTYRKRVEGMLRSFQQHKMMSRS